MERRWSENHIRSTNVNPTFYRPLKIRDNLYVGLVFVSHFLVGDMGRNNDFPDVIEISKRGAKCRCIDFWEIRTV